MMSSYYVELRYAMPGASREALDATVDELMEALLVEPNVTDPDVGVNLESGVFDVCVTVEAENDPAALATAITAVTSAAHHAGKTTHGWQELLRAVHESRVRRAELADL